MRYNNVVALACFFFIASCSPPPGSHSINSRPPVPSTNAAPYVEISTHEAPARPPEVLANGVGAKLVHAQWESGARPGSSENGNVPEPSSLDWPTTTEFTELTILGAKPPAAATINTFSTVSTNGLPSERNMTTINCVAGAPPPSPVGTGCWIIPPSPDGSAQISVHLDRQDRYLVLWAQWWTWREGQQRPEPANVRQVDASWAIASRAS